MMTLPDALRPLAAYNQFIVCQFVPDIVRPGKTHKYPINPHTGQRLDPHNPQNWLTADDAIRLKNLSNFGDCGVGFVLTAGDAIFCVDIDNCLQADNNWSETAKELCGMFQGAAVEISQSGKGLHIWGKYSGSMLPHLCKNSALGIELYHQKRFIALTGNGAIGSVATDCTGILAGLVSRYFQSPRADTYSTKEKTWTTEPCEEWSGPIDDGELINSALNAQSANSAFGNKASFGDLWSKNVGALNQAYPDPGTRPYDESSADAALAAHLAFWTGKNCERIRILMLKSALVREKWERPDYLPRTIQNAVARCTDVYCGRNENRGKAVLGSPTCFQKRDFLTEPKPIQATLHPVPAFDPEALLPDALRAWVMDEADRMPCPPDFIAAAAMVMAGSIIGARCAIKPKALDSWTIVPNLWGGIVGLPSSKKSPAIDAALKPLNRLITQAMELYQSDQEAFGADKTVFEAQYAAIESRIKTAAKAKSCNGESLDNLAKELQSHRQKERDEPVLRRYKSNDTTVEKLGELLRDNPTGLLVMRDELVGLIASWDKEGREGERAFYLEAWNGNASFDTDRIGRGSIFIPNLCVSIFGGIQPDKLTGYLEQAANTLANDGMLQRFQLLVYPDYRPWEWRDRTPAKDARDRAFGVFDTLAGFDPITWGATPPDDFAKFPHFRFDESAQEIFIEWSAKLHLVWLPAETHPIIAQHLAKFDKLFPALALILHLVDCAATGQSGPVSALAARRAEAWCDYLEAHARRCYGLLIDDGLRAAQALADKVRQGVLQDGFTARDVRRNQWRYLTSDDAVQAAVDWLEDENWLCVETVGGTGPGSGRRTFRYFINPKAINPEQFAEPP